MSEVFIVQQAKAFLHQSRILGGGAEFGDHRTQMAIAQTIASAERGRLLVAGLGQQVGS